MTSILFITPGWRGHSNHLYPVAEELRGRGHALAWLCTEGDPPNGGALGITNVAWRPVVGASAGHTSGGTPDFRDPGWWRQYFEKKALRVEPLRRAIQEVRPDVVATDDSLEAIIAARLAGVPLVVAHPNLSLIAPRGFDCEFFALKRASSVERERLLRQFGVRPRLVNFNALSPWQTAVFSTREFVGEGAAVPAGASLVGPSIPRGRRPDEPDFPWHRLSPSRRIVYVSFGTVAPHQPRLFSEIARAACKVDAQFVVAASNIESLSALPWPDDTLLVRYAPQVPLLERASVFLTHGGANSVMESLYAGVPMLVVPLLFEQPLQALLVERARVGLAIEPDVLSAEHVALTLSTLMQNSAYRRRAAEIKASYRRHDGARRIADLLLELGAR